MKSRLAPQIACVALLTALVQPSVAQESYSLRRNPKSGEVDKFKTVLKIDAKTGGGDVKIDVTLLTTETVKEVKSDGSYVVAATIDSAEVLVNGGAIPYSAGQTITTTYDKSGRIIQQQASSGGNLNPSQLLGLSRLGFAPEEPLKIGAQKKYENEFSTERRQSIAGTVTLLGMEKAGGDLAFDALKVKNVGDLKIQGQGGEQTIHYDTLTYLDPRSARLQIAEGTVTRSGQDGGAKIVFKVSRDKDKR